MKKLMILLLLGFTGGIFAQANPEITEELYRSRDAWNEGNIEKYMETYWQSDSLVFVGSKGLTYGWEQTLKNYKKSYATKEMMGRLEFTIHRLEIFNDNNAFMLGGWKIMREKGEISGYFTLLWKKIDGVWRIILDHSS